MSRRSQVDIASKNNVLLYPFCVNITHSKQFEKQMYSGEFTVALLSMIHVLFMSNIKIQNYTTHAL